MRGRTTSSRVASLSTISPRSHRAPGRARSISQDLEDLKGAIASGNLPAVAFYKPVGRDNEHPGYTNLSTGDAHVAELIELVQQSRNWNDTAIIVTADENGGS